MAENELEITQNGQYSNIDLRDMEDGDSIVLTKKYATIRREPKSKTQDGKTSEWVMCQGAAEYNGQDVGFFLNGHYTSEGYDEAEAFADKYDAVGGEGDRIKISMKKGMGKKFNKRTQKNEDVVTLLKSLHTYSKMESLAKAVNNYLGLLDPEGFIHSSFHLYVAETFRSSASDPNLQNVFKHDEDLSIFRRCIIPTEGRILLEVDYNLQSRHHRLHYHLLGLPQSSLEQY